MDWKSLTFDWNRARAVAATAETGSLSAAARALGLTQPTLGRQVTALEEELGVTLFTRAGKRMELTEAGLSLIDHLRTMAEAAHAAALAATGQSQEIAGAVTITAANLYASELLPPILGRIREEAPALQIQVVASNALSDLMRREADIAIRHVRPDQPDLTAKLVAEDDAALYATPDLLARGELTALPFIGYDRRSVQVHAGRARRRRPGRELRLFQRRLPYAEGDRTGWAGCRGIADLVPGPGSGSGQGTARGPASGAVPDLACRASRSSHLAPRRLVFDHLAEGFSRIGRGSQGRRDTVHPE
jgi:DNA-binding transcriptional LysR family regulator